MHHITLNGVDTQTDCVNLSQLLAQKKLNTGRFAVEVDGMLVAKTRLESFLLQNGQKIEVVSAVGGG